jgi:hypothetical protein
MLTAKEKKIVKKARELIASPDRWTQGAFAVTRQGLKVHPCSHDAYRFCAHGAVRRAA